MNLFRLTRLVVALISYHKLDYKARYGMEIDLEEEFRILKLGLFIVSVEKGYLLKKLELESYIKTLNSINFK